MTLQHENRIRKTSGHEVFRELEATTADELADGEPAEAEIRRHAHEICLVAKARRAKPCLIGSRRKWRFAPTRRQRVPSGLMILVGHTFSI